MDEESDKDMLVNMTSLGSNLNQKRFDSVKEIFLTLPRSRLFRKMYEITHEIFVAEEIQAKYPSEQHEQLIRSATDICVETCGATNSKDFIWLFRVRSARQDLMRDFVMLAMSHQRCILSDFEKTLLKHAVMIAHYFDRYFLAWCKKMQDPDLVSRLVDQKPQEPCALVFKSEINAIIEEMNCMVKELQEISDRDSNDEAYIQYFRHFVTCLLHDDMSTIENMWLQLDAFWMKIKGPVQVVHGTMRGFVDPLRVKIPPDFTIRLFDSQDDVTNKQIQAVKQTLVQYYTSRRTELATCGLMALSNSTAATYHVPILAGMSLHIGFQGQKFPARPYSQPRDGIKLFLDRDTTQHRLRKLRVQVSKVVDNPESYDNVLDVRASLSWIVAPHEFTHTLYNLNDLPQANQNDVTLLEEPRAQLAVLHTLTLLIKRRHIEQADVDRVLALLALETLRRFFDSDTQATKSYTIFAIHAFKVFFMAGYVTLEEGRERIQLHDDKASVALQLLSQQFEDILDAEDQGDTIKLVGIVRDMQAETPMIQTLRTWCSRHCPVSHHSSNSIQSNTCLTSSATSHHRPSIHRTLSETSRHLVSNNVDYALINSPFQHYDDRPQPTGVSLPTPIEQRMRECQEHSIVGGNVLLASGSTSEPYHPLSGSIASTSTYQTDMQHQQNLQVLQQPYFQQSTHLYRNHQQSSSFSTPSQQTQTFHQQFQTCPVVSSQHRTQPVNPPQYSQQLQFSAQQQQQPQQFQPQQQQLQQPQQFQPQQQQLQQQPLRFQPQMQQQSQRFQPQQQQPHQFQPQQQLQQQPHQFQPQQQQHSQQFQPQQQQLQQQPHQFQFQQFQKQQQHQHLFQPQQQHQHIFQSQHPQQFQPQPQQQQFQLHSQPQQRQFQSQPQPQTQIQSQLQQQQQQQQQQFDQQQQQQQQFEHQQQQQQQQQQQFEGEQQQHFHYNQTDQFNFQQQSQNITVSENQCFSNTQIQPSELPLAITLKNSAPTVATYPTVSSLSDQYQRPLSTSSLTGILEHESSSILRLPSPCPDEPFTPSEPFNDLNQRLSNQHQPSQSPMNVDASGPNQSILSSFQNTPSQSATQQQQQQQPQLHGESQNMDWLQHETGQTSSLGDNIVEASSELSIPSDFGANIFPPLSQQDLFSSLPSSEGHLNLSVPGQQHLPQLQQTEELNMISHSQHSHPYQQHPQQQQLQSNHASPFTLSSDHNQQVHQLNQPPLQQQFQISQQQQLQQSSQHFPSQLRQQSFPHSDQDLQEQQPNQFFPHNLPILQQSQHSSQHTLQQLPQQRGVQQLPTQSRH